MPRSIDTYEKHPLVSWTDVSIADIQRLHEHKASGLTIRVWLVLKTYAWNKRTCFPSIKSIAERMGYDLTKNYTQTIGKALRWLDDNGFIKRKSRRSRERFTLTKSNSEPNDSVRTEPNSSWNKTQENNTQTPLPPTDAGGATTKQKIRSRRRRKRLRKADKRHMAKVAQQNETDRISKESAIASYKQAQAQAPQILQTLLDEHQRQETPQTKEQATRAFLVSSILHYYEWIDKPLIKPDHITLVSHMIKDAEELTWSLRMNVFDLWEHVRRNLTPVEE